MATAVLSPSLPSDQPTGANVAAAAAAAGSFSPLTLFECTMTNASMLVDSMTVRDLVSALRIIGTLHTHVVNIMDPGVASACDMADQFAVHRATCPAAAAAASTTAPASQGSGQESPGAADRDPPPRRKRLKVNADDDFPGASGDNNGCGGASAAAFVKSESVVESDDDCCILDESGISNSAFFASVRHMNPLPGPHLPQLSGTASGSSQVLGHDAAAMKQVLRSAYKSLRAGGPHLYDFNRPWNDPANQAITERIVSHIIATTPNMPVSPDEWRSGIDECVRTVLDDELRNIKSRGYKRRYSRITGKLSRRQKAFEQVLPSLDPDDLDRFRVVLSRDFTSSDEETEDEASGEAALRVRELSWESDEVRRVKQRLDVTFMNRFATQKQRVTLQRCIRDSGCLSVRPPPHEAPAWALRQLSLSVPPPLPPPPLD